MTPVRMIRRVLQGTILNDVGEKEPFLGEKHWTLQLGTGSRLPAAHEAVARTQSGKPPPPRNPPAPEALLYSGLLLGAY